MKLIAISSTDSSVEVMIRRQRKKINLLKNHSLHQILQSTKVKVHSQRSCSPDMIKLHLMKDILKVNSQLVMIDLKARICLLGRIVIQDKLNAKEPHRGNGTQPVKVSKLQFVKVSKPQFVKASKLNREERFKDSSNLRINQQKKEKIHIQLQLLS